MITITDQAVSQIKLMAKEEGLDNPTLRFGVTGGGCSGLSYTLGFGEKTENDEILDFDGLTVLIDKKDLLIVKGTIIDYKHNMIGGGFTIDNPNAIFSCGCGSSFRTKDNAGNPGEC